MVVVRVVSADLCTASGGEQIHVCIFKGLDKALHYMEIPVFIFLHMIPVSYTHLDVYKRQGSAKR